MHSWMPSAQAIFAAMDFRLRDSCTLADSHTIRKDTGSTHKDASAIRQSKKKMPAATNKQERMEPASSGIK